jgi:hypothetical protein
MTEDSLLRQLYVALLEEHASLALEYGDMIPIGQQYHDSPCSVCAALKDVDKEIGLQEESPPIDTQ